MRWPVSRMTAVGAVVLLAPLAMAAPVVAADEDPGRRLAPSVTPDEAPASSTPRDALSASALTFEEGDDEDVALAFSREGAYLGLGGSYAFQNFSIPGDQDDAATVMFRAGYRGYPWLSVDLLGEVLTTFEGSDALDNDVNGYAVTFNARIIAPLGRVEPWAMIGIGFLDVDEDIHNGRRDDFTFRSAVGADLYLSPHWALYAEAAYLLPTGDVKDFDYGTVGAGILFRF